MTEDTYSRPMPAEPGILGFLARSEELYPDDAVDAPVARQRDYYDALCAAFDAPLPAGLDWQDDVLADVPVRHYRPATLSTETRLLYIHGGGFVVGSRDSHHAICAEIAEGTGARLTAVDYRLAPEHVWPAASDDAFAVFSALLAAGERVVTVGDSAGGNLAAGLAVRNSRRQSPLPGSHIGQALIYPALGGDLTRGSFREMAEAPGLTTADVAYYREILQAPAEDPVAHPLCAETLAGVPATYLTAAMYDPLRDDCADYARRLIAEGIECWHRVEPQMVHAWLRARHCSPGAAAGFAALIHALRHLARSRP